MSLNYYPKGFRRADYSLLQSAVAHVARQEGQATSLLATNHPNMQAVNERLEQLQSAPTLAQALPRDVGTVAQCVDLLARYAKCRIFGPQSEADDIKNNELKDSPCDLGWATSVADYIDYYASGVTNPKYTAWTNLTDFVYPLPDAGSDGKTLTVGILGDWGTGEPVAQAVLQNMMNAKPDLIVHVGDIYYAGTNDECTGNFLDNITTYAPQTPIYTLPGNHEYYSGGVGYYSILPRLNQFASWAKPQQASFFCLNNSWLQLQGMDTGYNAGQLLEEIAGCEKPTSLYAEPLNPEITWHMSQINNGVAAKRRILLLSHHQPFSAYSAIGGGGINSNLLGSFASPLAAGNITAWLWGHEHVCELYGSPITLSPPTGSISVKGRCIGHSAFPVLQEEAPYKVVNPNIAQFSEPYQLGLSSDGQVYNHGYMILQLDPTSGQALYYEVDGGSGQFLGLKYTETLYGTP
jgi:Calcineurin-like phosphoesterase